jgi:hypothetical protein
MEGFTAAKQKQQSPGSPKAKLENPTKKRIVDI